MIVLTLPEIGIILGWADSVESERGEFENSGESALLKMRLKTIKNKATRARLRT